MLASFVATGLGIAGTAVALGSIIVPVFVRALRSPVDVDQLDPKNCHNCDI